jgi:V8-like Glu-specific endopeptidase
MARIIFLIFILMEAWITPAQADEGFFKLPNPSAGPEQIQALSTASSSVLRLSDQYGDVCTGFFVSQSGYLLTAAHCLRSCFENAKIETVDQRQNPTYKIATYPKSLKQSFACQYQLQDGSVLRAKVIATGSGYAEFDDRTAENIPRAVQNKISQIKDYALLKLNLKKKSSCLHLNFSNIAGYEQVSIIGFPVAAKRANGSLDGHSAYLSLGHIESSLEKNTDYLSQNFFENKIRLLEGLYNLKTSFISNADLVGGSSGSPVLNNAGDVIGIATDVAAFSDGSLQFVDDSAIAIRVTAVREDLKHRFSDQELKEFFTCEIN